MKVCPNRACPFLEEFGEIAEYRDEITLCADCQTPLVDRTLAPTFSPSTKADAQAADAETLVVIATFDHPLQGHLHRARLEAEGIPAFLFNEQMVINNWLMTKALGGVRLAVPESAEETALAILTESVQANGIY